MTSPIQTGPNTGGPDPGGFARAFFGAGETLAFTVGRVALAPENPLAIPPDTFWSSPAPLSWPSEADVFTPPVASPFRAIHPDPKEFYRPYRDIARDAAPPTPEELKDRADKRKRLRNETITMTEQTLMYGGVALVEMSGMYYQRVDAPGAEALPLYNPDAPYANLGDLSWGMGILGNMEVLKHSLDDRITGFVGRLASGIYGIGDHAAFLANAERVAEAEFLGDKWYSIGNFLKFTGQYVFSFLYRGETGFARKVSAWAEEGFAPAELDAFYDAGRRFSASSDNAERGRAALTWLGYAARAAGGHVAIRLGSAAKAMVSPSRWWSAFRRGAGAAQDIFVSTRGVARNLSLEIAFLSRPDGREFVAARKLSPDELARRHTARATLAKGDLPARLKARITLAASDLKALRALADGRIEAWVADERAVEVKLAGASTKRAFYTATEKFMKFAAPLAVANGAPHGSVLPFMAAAHLAIIVSGYYVWRGTLPKMALSRNKAKQSNMLQQLGVSLGLYTGKAIQSAYTLYAGAAQMVSGFATGSLAAKELYTNALQAGRSMPGWLSGLTTFVIVAPSVFSLKKEGEYLVSAARDLKANWRGPEWQGFTADSLAEYASGLNEGWRRVKDSTTEHFSEVDRLTNHAMGITSTTAALFGAWYMGDFQTMPLGWLFCSVSALVTGARALHKHKETIRESLRKRRAARAVQHAPRFSGII